MNEAQTTSIMLSQPRVSVLMLACRPNPVFLRKAVQSVLRQTCEDLELLVVETPSAQPASDILNGCDDGRLRYVVGHPHATLTDQRNLGLAEAQAPLVAILDDDDIAHPERLRAQVEYLHAHPDVDVVCSQIAIIDSEDRIIGYRVFPERHEGILRALPRIVPFAHPAVTYRREVVLAAGGYAFHEYGVAEDYELWSRLAQRGARFANLPDVLQYYRHHDCQLKTIRLRETIRAVLRVKQLYWSDTQGLRGRLRILGERLMLYLPKPWVLALLRCLHYHANPRINPALRAAPSPTTFLDLDVVGIR